MKCSMKMMYCLSDIYVYLGVVKMKQAHKAMQHNKDSLKRVDQAKIL